MDVLLQKFSLLSVPSLQQSSNLRPTDTLPSDSMAQWLHFMAQNISTKWGT